MFLGQLGRGVDVARIAGRLLVHQPGQQCGAAPRAGRLEPARVQIGRTTRAGGDLAVFRATVATLPVHDHGPGQDQCSYAGAVHRREQHGGPQVVAAHVLGSVVQVQPQTHHRGLVTHHVHALQRLLQQRGVPHVTVPERDLGRQLRRPPRGVDRR